MALSTIPTRALSEQGINFRNLIINGDMSIAQRGTSQASISSAGYYTLDRWRFGPTSSSGVYTMTQDSDVPTGQGFSKSMKLSCTSSASMPSTGNVRIQYNWEGQMLQHLKAGTASAEYITLSFWVKTNKTGTYVVEFSETDNSTMLTQTFTVSSADTWEKKTISIRMDTANSLDNDNLKSFTIFWWLAAGTTYTTGSVASSWQANNNADRAAGLTVNLSDSTSNYLNITGVQLEVGTSASDFEFLPWDVNFSRCLRYYEKSYDYGTTAGTSTESGTSSLNGLSTSSKQIRTHDTRFTVQKRTNPTVTIYDKSGNSGKWTTYDSGGGGTDNLAYGGVITKNTNSFDIYASNSTASGYQFHYTSDAEL